VEVKVRDNILSRAMETYYGDGQKAGQFPNDVLANWGDEMGETLIAQIRSISAEMFAMPVNWATETNIQAANRLRDVMVQTHPELTREAIERLANYYAFSSR
jgi:hypothetical protein